MPHQLISFPIHGDERGSLIACEQYHNIPFDIKRVYYIFDTREGEVRGKHAHRDLQQILICVSGGCRVTVQEHGQKKVYHLQKPTVGLYIAGLVWREMSDFSADCVLLVLADQYFQEDDYIRDYQVFRQLDEEAKEVA